MLRFDTEIDMIGLAAVPGIVRSEIKPQVDEWTFPDGHSVIVLSEGRLMNLGNACVDVAGPYKLEHHRY